LKDNSENYAAKGEDIIACDRFGNKEKIQVKGYPSEVYANGPNKGTPKTRTSPKLQAHTGYQV